MAMHGEDVVIEIGVAVFTENETCQVFECYVFEEK